MSIALSAAAFDRVSTVATASARAVPRAALTLETTMTTRTRTRIVTVYLERPHYFDISAIGVADATAADFAAVAALRAVAIAIS